MSGESCPVCKAYVSDWLEQPSREGMEFHKEFKKKRIIKHIPEISGALYRIIYCLNNLTNETIVKSDEYRAENILDFYKSSVDIMNCENIPIEDRPLIQMFYRNEMIKCIFRQTCNTDLEHVVAVISDANCSSDLFILTQWISYCIYNLRHVEFIHNDHKHSLKL